MSEVPLYSVPRRSVTVKAQRPCMLHRYVAHKKSHPLGPYSRPIPGALRLSWGGGQSLVSEAPLFSVQRALEERAPEERDRGGSKCE